MGGGVSRPAWTKSETLSQTNKINNQGSMPRPIHPSTLITGLLCLTTSLQVFRVVLCPCASLCLNSKAPWGLGTPGLRMRLSPGLGPCVLFFFQSLLLSASIKREGDSPTASPHSSATEDLHHSDRYQVRRVWLASG